MNRIVLTLPLAALAVASPASAEVTTYIGAALTSDYISAGETQTDGKPAFQPYVEFEWPVGIYAGVWMSNVDFGDDDSIEIDLYTGYRGEAGPLSYDLVYYAYYYDNSGYCCQELDLELGYALGESVSMTTTFSAYFDGTGSAEQGVNLTLPADFELFATYEAFTDDGGQDWSIGISRYLTDTVSVSLGWYDASYVDDGRAALTISWDTDWATLRGQ